MAVRTLYLAGPDVFLRDAAAIGAAKKQMCEAAGFSGYFPLDTDFDSERAEGLSRRIYDANVLAIRRCDAVVANLTPFRGIGADPGTIFEVGYAIALGKAVFGYANTTRLLRDRIADTFGLAAGGDDKPLYAGDGMIAEDFGLADNLMIVEAIHTQGRNIVLRDVPAGREWSDLQAFAACLEQALDHYGVKRRD
jgi:nucleoside 2-deoxyribosyltransferase